MPIPVAPGACIRNQQDPDYAGTLGCLVRSRVDASQVFLLTAGHVINRYGYAGAGEVIEMYYQGTWIAIARFERAARIVDDTNVKQRCDAAIARIQLPPDMSLQLTSAIEGIGTPTSVASNLAENMRLRFRGAGTSGIRDGYIESTGNYTPIQYTDNISGQTYVLNYSGQIVYGDNSSGSWVPCTQGRDSGAVLMADDGGAVGLHIGATGTAFPVSASICTPLQVVLDALGVDLLDAQSTIAAPANVPAFDEKSAKQFTMPLSGLLEVHNRNGGISWRLGAEGIYAGGKLDRTVGLPVTVRGVLNRFRGQIIEAACKHKVPVELIVATICTETHGVSDAVHREPGWIDDNTTPDKVSVGLMQTLISTARKVSGRPNLSGDALRDPGLSIDLGTAYIASQFFHTQYDPPLVACAYNHGRLSYSSSNRWHLVQTGDHADRFVAWFNDCMACMNEFELAQKDIPSFSYLFQ